RPASLLDTSSIRSQLPAKGIASDVFAFSHQDAWPLLAGIGGDSGLDLEKAGSAASDRRFAFDCMVDSFSVAGEPRPAEARLVALPGGRRPVLGGSGGSLSGLDCVVGTIAGSCLQSSPARRRHCGAGRDRFVADAAGKAGGPTRSLLACWRSRSHRR